MTYWGFQYSLPFIGKRASQIPLGLVTVAALLPRRWQLRLVDLNVRRLREGDLRWSDVVLTGGMSEAEGRVVAERLMHELGIQADELIACAYVDFPVAQARAASDT